MGPKDLDLKNTAATVPKDVLLILNILKELYELHNDYPFSPGKVEIKREMLSKYQLMIADFYKIPIRNVKKLGCNFF